MVTLHNVDGGSYPHTDTLPLIELETSAGAMTVEVAYDSSIPADTAYGSSSGERLYWVPITGADWDDLSPEDQAEALRLLELEAKRFDFGKTCA